MFGVLAVILVVAWFLGFSVFHVAGGMIHLLLLVAVVSIIVALHFRAPHGYLTSLNTGRIGRSGPPPRKWDHAVTGAGQLAPYEAQESSCAGSHS